MNFDCYKNKKSKTNLIEVADFLKVIAEPNRLKILCILLNQEMCVCDISQYFDLPQNLTSHHLKVLKDFKLVELRKESTKIIYSVNSQVLNKYYSFLSNCINNK